MQMISERKKVQMKEEEDRGRPLMTADFEEIH